MSPVVGVMLMLVVTIIIAAVVSAFSGGLGSGTKVAPQAVIDVKISTTGGSGASMDGSEANIVFKLMSGDPIPTKDLAIITYYTNRSGTTIKHEQTVLSSGTDLYGSMNYTKYCEDGYTSYCGIGNDVHAMGRVPFLNDMRYGYAGSFSAADTGTASNQNFFSDFGNFTWTSGSMMSTNGDAGTADLLGINSTATPHTITDPDFGTGSVVEVKILHKPSNKYLFDKEVIVS